LSDGRQCIPRQASLDGAVFTIKQCLCQVSDGLYEHWRPIEIIATTESLLSCPHARQISGNVPAVAGFLCDKAALVRDTIRGQTSDKILVISRNLLRTSY
jgi:hypothetical protein